MTSAISKVLRHIYFFPPSPLRVFGVFGPEGGISFCGMGAIDFHAVVYECAEWLEDFKVK